MSREEFEKSTSSLNEIYFQLLDHKKSVEKDNEDLQKLIKDKIDNIVDITQKAKEYQNKSQIPENKIAQCYVSHQPVQQMHQHGFTQIQQTQTIQQMPHEIPPQNTADNVQDDLVIKQLTDKVPHPARFCNEVEISNDSYVCSAAYSYDGKYLAFGSHSVLQFYHLETEEICFTDKHGSDSDGNIVEENYIRSLAWTHDSKYIICGYEAKFIDILNIERDVINRIITEKTEGGVFQIQCSTDGNFFVTADGQGWLSCWDLRDIANRKVTQMWKRRKSKEDANDNDPNASGDGDCISTSLSLSDDNKYVAVGHSDKFVTIWDISTQNCLMEKECHKSGVYSIKYLPDNRIATASLDNNFIIWNIIEKNNGFDLEMWKLFEGHSNYVLSLALDPAKKWLLSGSKDMNVILTSLESGEMCYKIKAHENSVITVAFSQDGKGFCTGSGDKNVKIWSIQYINE